MKSRIHTKTGMKQRHTLKWVVGASSMAVLVVAYMVFFSSTVQTEKAYAETCENSYVLNWSDTTTWDVDCGDVNASNWNVKGITCNYYSPVFTASGSPGGPLRELTISVRINQSGNLDANDTAWVFTHVNGAIQDTTMYLGGVSAAVFIMQDTLQIPSGGTYMVSVRCRNDKTNELWQIKNGDVTTCLKALSPLPITLIDFTAKTTAENKVRLDWATQTEVNNEYFTIERSATGQTWKTIGTVNGAGTVLTPRNYTYYDDAPLSGNNYYRLKQTDFDGTTAVFKTVFARVGASAGTSATMTVFPNPFSSSFNLKFPSEEEQTALLRLVAASGKTVHHENISVTEGLNRHSIQLPVRVPPGLYTVQVQGDHGLSYSAKAVCR